MFEIGEVQTKISTNYEFQQKRTAGQGKIETQKGLDTYTHQFHTVDMELIDYVREVAPNTILKDDSLSYLRQLWEKKGRYLKTIREEKGSYGYNDIVNAAACAYDSLYQEIVKGHDSGERKLYVMDDSNGKRHFMTKEEELEKLNRGYEELIKWEQMVAKSRMQMEAAKKRFGNDYLEEIYSLEQVENYIEDSYNEFKSAYPKYQENRNQKPIAELIFDILQKNKEMFGYCTELFSKVSYVMR
uniref:hypothetical protein n=1 Tax=Agathobacter sp. TaxID=2021311 RepID=UPI004056E7B7